MHKDLVERLKSDDENAFRELVEEFKDKVFSTCFHYLHNRLDAEDLAQEVFIEVHRSIKSFKEDAQLSTWIYRIAVNKSLDLIRKRKRKKRFGYLISLGADDDEKEIQIPISGNPQKDLEIKERMQLLNNALAKLPETQKTVITLSKYEGFSNKEIAEVMDTSVSSVESLMHRAKKNLQKKLQNYFEELII